MYQKFLFVCLFSSSGVLVGKRFCHERLFRDNWSSGFLPETKDRKRLPALTTVALWMFFFSSTHSKNTVYPLKWYSEFSAWGLGLWRSSEIIAITVDFRTRDVFALRQTGSLSKADCCLGMSHTQLGEGLYKRLNEKDYISQEKGKHTQGCCV